MLRLPSRSVEARSSDSRCEACSLASVASACASAARSVASLASAVSALICSSRCRSSALGLGTGGLRLPDAVRLVGFGRDELSVRGAAPPPATGTTLDAGTSFGGRFE